MNKYILLVGLVTILTVLAVQCVFASWSLVPNGSFESGTVGLVPDNWTMIAANLTDPPDGPKTATFIHEMKQTDQKYFEGSKSLWLHSRVVDEGLRQGRGSQTIAETEDWINAPSATHVRIYIRDIESTHSLYWGWSNYIMLYINNGSIASSPYGAIWAHGEFLNFNYYNYTSMGADGENWYVYEYPIPESVDKTHMKIEIVCHAWDWTFYSTSYFSDLEFFVDKVELLLAVPHGPTASFTATPETANVGQAITFDASASTPGSNGTHEMPITEYRWDFGDGNNTIAHTPIISHGYSGSGIYYVTLTAYAPGATPETNAVSHKVTIVSMPVGGYSFSVERSTVPWSTTSCLALAAVLAIGLATIRRKTTRKTK